MPQIVFQSTLSVRRATRIIHRIRLHPIISIHALRKESDFTHVGWRGHITISIHALRKESDVRLKFNLDTEGISIHALRKESDPSGVWSCAARSNFNPRSP